jgi:hypothetical protein
MMPVKWYPINSSFDTEMYGSSLPNGQAGDLFVVEYWVTDKESDNHIFDITS